MDVDAENKPGGGSAGFDTEWIKASATRLRSSRLRCCLANPPPRMAEACDIRRTAPMPAPAHEVPLALLHEHPELLAALFEKLGRAAPEGKLVTVDTNLRFADPTEVRPDLVFRAERPRWLLVELQNRIGVPRVPSPRTAHRRLQTAPWAARGNRDGAVRNGAPGAPGASALGSILRDPSLAGSGAPAVLLTATRDRAVFTLRSAGAAGSLKRPGPPGDRGIFLEGRS